MTRTAKIYISAVIAAGAGALLLGLWYWVYYGGARFWVLPLVALVAASLLKVRLPGMQATYSLSSLVLLYGVFNDQLPATLVAACLAAVAPSFFNTKSKVNWLRVSFNVANLALSVVLCFLATHTLRQLSCYEPAILTVAACLYFTVNIGLTSGAVSLTGGLPFSGSCSEWYVWTAPYYLVGATMVALIAGAGSQTEATGWLIPIPLLYMVHFFSSLANSRVAVGTRPENPSQLPPWAAVYVYGVIAAGLALAVVCGARWHSEDPMKLAAFAALAIVASMLKIRLPGMTGTLSLNFVLLIVAAAEMNVGEAVLLGAIAAVVQCLWHAKRRPPAVQVAFNSACLMLGTTMARWGYLAAIDHLTPASVLAPLIPATMILYFSNTLLVTTVLCLMEDKPLIDAWQQCNFWALPYYLVGATAAALMICAGRSTGWYSSLLLLPALAMVFASYRLHVSRLVVSPAAG